MEINIFAKCVKELILENDRVAVPHLGVFSAGMMPAAYSDRQTAINPPYRKMTFRKEDVSLEDGRMMLEKVRNELGVSSGQAVVELDWCLSRFNSELESSKICRLPGLGLMRANARNEFYFVPDDDLDIWPDGIGLETVSLRLTEKVKDVEAVDAAVPEAATVVEDAVPVRRKRRHGLLAAIVVLILLLLFILAAYAFPEQMSPILDPLLYSKEELELLRS